MKKYRLWGICWGVLLLGISATAQAALVGRLPATPGGTDYQAYYDANANLTWLANADANGVMDWTTANTWSQRLDIGGVTGWRLPATLQIDPTCTDQLTGVSGGFDCTGSEMGNLFYKVLGLVAGSPQSADVPFSNFGGAFHWSVTPDSRSFTNDAFVFDMGTGEQTEDFKFITHLAWAVHSGYVTPVPLPSALWLMLTALGFWDGYVQKSQRRRQCWRFASGWLPQLGRQKSISH